VAEKADLMSSPQSGDPCLCGGRIHVVNTRILGNTRIRYLGCRRCGFRPANNKVQVPLANALLEYCPDREKWEKESLRNLYQEMVQRRRRSPEERKGNGAPSSGERAARTGSTGQDDAEKLRAKCRELLEENAALHRKLAEADQEIAALREQVAQSKEAELATV
jgi:hypothetical protein